jgi:ribosomal protein S8
LNLKMKNATSRKNVIINIPNSKHMKTVIDYFCSENLIHYKVQTSKHSICLLLKYNTYEESSIMFLKTLNKIQRKLDLLQTSVRLQQNQCNDILFLNSYGTFSKHGKAVIKIK